MITKARKYFSFFGMMATASDMKTKALYSLIGQLETIMPQINRFKHLVVLKPVQTKTIQK